MKTLYILLVLALVGAAFAQSDPPKNCVDDKKTGMCRAYFPSWYYNKKSGKCEKFIYGGCGGNGNRYKSEDDCKKNCVKA
ncbi:Kunitz-type serine protease inhibitor like protein [Argiope bruennichi]|uniref:Kunitz-type serine protease inhibitor like protein n=1 Tax=Argiope bruennichi TaxID=94029 RepID=A0A8T0DXP3_ARGBR|nr:Kunitz-type serine protease inhibitor like protein [Argiope bruennichi]